MLTSEDGTRRSLRVRNKSANKNPDFVHDLDPLNSAISLDNLIRGRSSSLSFAKKEKQVQLQDKSISEVDLVTPNKPIKHPGTPLIDKQVKLSQQRLDLWVNKPDVANTKSNCYTSGRQLSRAIDVANLSIEDDGNWQTSQDRIEKCENSTYKRSQVLDVKLQGDAAASELQSTNITDGCEANVEETEKGKQTNTGIKGVVFAEDNNSLSDENAEETEDMASVEAFAAVVQQMNNTLKKALEDKIDRVKDDLKNDLTEVKQGNAAMQKRITDLETENKRMNTELTTVSTQLKVCQLQLTEVIGVVIRQDQKISEHDERMELAENQLNKDVLRIQGLGEHDKSELKAKIDEFLKEKLKIEQTIKLKDYYQIGRGKNATTVIQLSKVMDRSIIFNGAKNLKDLISANGKPFQIKGHQTAKTAAKNRRVSQIRAINNRNTAHKLSMSVERAKLKINGEEYRKTVQPRHVVKCCEPLQNSVQQQRI